jgi:cytochrome b subunit of formate dehydrogenase
MSSHAASGYVVRFSLRQRIEHFAIMTLFILLSLTGFPQKFPDAGWAIWLNESLGGVQVLRFLHRGAGLLLGALTVFHFVVVIAGVAMRRMPLSMVPTRQDFSDAIRTLRYYLRLTDSPARFGRFDYREKFEYWGLVIGNLVMVSTGLVLLMPILASRFLGGELVPVAKVAHSNEGLMALLVVVTWHVFNAHFAPDIFPFNDSIFTGRISKEHLKRDHPLEYERLFPEEAAAAAVAEAPPSAPEPAASERDG